VGFQQEDEHLKAKEATANTQQAIEFDRNV
jgi:hypothetical protein